MIEFLKALVEWMWKDPAKKPEVGAPPHIHTWEFSSGRTEISYALFKYKCTGCGQMKEKRISV